MKNLLKSIMLIVLLSMAVPVSSQVTQSYSQCLTQYGSPTGTGLTDNGNFYCYYDEQYRTVQSGTYTHRKALYFMTINNVSICYSWRIYEPSSETNTNIIFYNSQFVTIGNLRWKDYTTGLIYDISMRDGLCVTEVWLDNN